MKTQKINNTLDLIIEIDKLLVNKSLLKRYIRDFYFHDRNAIERRGINKGFIIAVRESGTYMIKLFNAEELPAHNKTVPYLFGSADFNRILKNEENMIEYVFKHQNEYDQFFYWNGSKLREYDQNNGTALIQIVKNHNSKIRKQLNQKIK